LDINNIIGNNEIKEYLESSLENNNILHSYLFLGTEGIGKRMLAKNFAKGILCLEEKKNNCTCKSCICFDGKNHPDFNLINEEGEGIKIDQIREITKKVIEKPIISERKVYIINDCDKMTKEAQNCLLKTLEEPPEFVTLILISSNENLILNTIKSRCMKLKFQNIDDESLKKYAIENLQYNEISDNMLKSFGGSIGKAEKLKENSDKYKEIENFTKLLMNKNLPEIMQIGKVLYDKENIYDILDYLIVCLYSNSSENKKYLNCIELVNKCISRLKINSNFDMSIDSLLMEMWEELNEKNNWN
jgi:DNA polymerase-3 subunit delta'